MQNTRANETHSYTPNDKYINLGYASHCYYLL